MSVHLVYCGFDLPLSLAMLCGIVVCYFVYLTVRPLLEEGDLSAEEWERMEDESIALLNRRDRIIEELRDLEFEAGMNKVEGKDLDMLRALYQNEALQVIQELDEQVGRYQDQIQAQVNERLDAAEQRRQAQIQEREGGVSADSDASVESDASGSDNTESAEEGADESAKVVDEGAENTGENADKSTDTVTTESGSDDSAALTSARVDSK